MSDRRQSAELSKVLVYQSYYRTTTCTLHVVRYLVSVSGVLCLMSGVDKNYAAGVVEGFN